MTPADAPDRARLLPEHVQSHEDLPEAAWAKREEIWMCRNLFTVKQLVDEFADILRAEANERIRAASGRPAADEDVARPTFAEVLAAMTPDDLRVLKRLRIMGLGTFDERHEKVVPRKNEPTALDVADEYRRGKSRGYSIDAALSIVRNVNAARERAMLAVAPAQEKKP